MFHPLCEGGCDFHLLMHIRGSGVARDFETVPQLAIFDGLKFFCRISNEELGRGPRPRPRTLKWTGQGHDKGALADLP